MEFNYTVNTPILYNTVRDVLKNYFLVSSRLLLKLKNNNCVFLNNKKCSINCNRNRINNSIKYN